MHADASRGDDMSELIDTADIAADLNLERDYVTRKVVKRPSSHRPCWCCRARP